MSNIARNIKFIIASYLASLLGSHCVYMYYQPMADFDEMVDIELEELIEEHKKKKKMV